MRYLRTDLAKQLSLSPHCTMEANLVILGTAQFLSLTYLIGCFGRIRAQQ